MSRIRAWSFTWNNYTEDDIIYIKNLSYNYLIYGKEVGEEKNTPHLQGFIYFSNGKNFERVRKLFKNNHVEDTKCIPASINYCMKEGDYYEYGTKPQQGKKKEPEEEIDLIKPDRPWQSDIMQLISEKPDYRSIYWYWDSIGNTGKSAFTKYLCATKDALCVSGKSNDCKYAIVKYKEQKKKYPNIIIFDIPRTNIDYLNYEAIESIKNGCFFSGKYECAQVIMNCPHVIIFANSPPQEYKLSADRWNIIKIDSDLLDQRIDNNMSDEDLYKLE